MDTIGRCARGFAVVATMLLTLAGCGGGGGDSEQLAASGNASANTPPITVSGRVLDGPVSGAQITVIDRDGEVIASVSNATDNTGRFSIELPGNTRFPVELRTRGGNDEVSRQPIAMQMGSLVLKPNPANPRHSRANINPASTLILEAARAAAGGLALIESPVLDEATARVVRGFDLSVSDPLDAPLRAEEVPGFLLGQQALAEALRRGRGPGEDFIEQIAAATRAVGSDLADGVLDDTDGHGAALELQASQPLLSALFEVRGELAQGVFNLTTPDGGITNVAAFEKHFELAKQRIVATLPGGGTSVPGLGESNAGEQEDGTTDGDDGEGPNDGATEEDRGVTPVPDNRPSAGESTDRPGNSAGGDNEDKTADEGGGTIPNDPEDNGDDAGAGDDPADDNAQDGASGGSAGSDTGGDGRDTESPAGGAEGESPEPGDTGAGSGDGDDSSAPDSGDGDGAPDHTDANGGSEDGSGEAPGDSGEEAATEPPEEQTEDPEPVEQGVTVEWSAPKQRVDGGGLDMGDLGGYILSIGTVSNTYDRNVDIPGGNTMEYTLGELDPGTYYLAVRAYDTENRISAYSKETTITIE